MPITIRQLLTHTSGITYGNTPELQLVFAKNEMGNAGLSHPDWTSEQYINKLATLPLAFQPGEKYQYGLNMDVLGRVIEVVAGQSLSAYFQEHIFEPLGMEETYFYLPTALQKRLVPVYTETKEKRFTSTEDAEMAKYLDYPNLPDHPFYSGGGGLSSTAMDYATFIQALLNGGIYDGQRILKEETIAVMTTDQMAELNKIGKGYSKEPGETYGLGFSLLTQASAGHSTKSPGTYEWGGYFNTKFFIDPAAELIFVGMTQIVPFSHGEFWDKLYNIMYGAIGE
jgi:CubicO group peptidase (beta-lactamase class C family)